MRAFALFLSAVMMAACGESDESEKDTCTWETLDARVSADTVLDGCYEVTQNVNVEDGALLTIAPGSVLAFDEDTRLEIKSDGALKAVGTADAPIRLTGMQETRGFWRGVRFNGTEDIDNVLDYVIIEYAGSHYFSSSGDNTNLFINDSRVAVRNCTLRESAGYGFFFHLPNVTEFDNNSITANDSAAGSLYANDIGQLGETSTYQGNGADYVQVTSDTVEVEQTWPAIDVPYFFSEGMTRVDADLTVAAGAALHFGQDASLEVYASGSMNATGTPSAPIHFTGQQQTSGYWRGIRYNGTNDLNNVLDHVTIEYGGSHYFSSAGDESNLLVTNARLDVSSTTIKHSAGYGIYDYQSEVTLDNVTYDDNTAGDYQVVD